MKRKLLLIFLLMLFSAETVVAENSPKGTLTQADLITGLVNSLGWSFGLPDDPKIEDYTTILNGRRSWQFEIEDVYIPSAAAPLLPKEIRSFGPYSGKFWHRAPAREITAEFEFLIPLTGNYEIKAALTKAGYKISFNGTELTADGERNFSIVSFGKIEMTAGVNKLQITIPPRGGIDYLILDAPPLPSLAPISGWEPDKKLTVDELAWVLSQTLQLQTCLVPLPNELIIEAEGAPAPANTKLSQDRYQGPMQGQWVKAGIRMAPYTHLFEIKQAGIYDLSLNILARSEVTGFLNSKDFFKITPKPYFSIVDSGSFYLEQGVNQIDIELPPRAGLDRIILKPRSCKSVDFLQLTGLEAQTELTAGQLDQILQLLAAIGPQR